MVESSSHIPSSPEITPKEELITLDKPESPNPFLHADQIEFSFDEIAFTINNEVSLLYPSHPNSEYFREVLDFISKCCLKKAFTRAPTQYKEYVCELCLFHFHSESASGCDALTDCTAKADPGLFDPNDSIPSQQEFLDLLSQISLVQKKLKTLDSLPGLLNKVTNTLNMFATVVEIASGATTKHVPSACQATASPTEGEKNTNPAIKDAERNLHDELFDILGIDVATQYYNKKLLYDKYCDKMLKRRKISNIINCDVLT
nr:hypothetical protein [Tanacetum cinerariifolium]